VFLLSLIEIHFHSFISIKQMIKNQAFLHAHHISKMNYSSSSDLDYAL